MGDEQTYQIPIPADSDGFVSFQCPFCGYRFKLSAEEFNAADVTDLYCPSCGLQNTPDSFLTDEMRDYMEAYARSIAMTRLNAMVDDMARSLRGSRNLTFKKGSRLPEDEPMMPGEVDDLYAVAFICCGRRAKVGCASDPAGFYCPYCGVKYQ